MAAVKALGMFLVAAFVVGLTGNWSATAQGMGSTGGTTGGYVGISKYYTFGNAKYGVQFTANPSDQSGHNSDGTPVSFEGQKLSGTNVEFTLLVHTWKPGVPPFPGPPVNNESTITDIQVYLLGGGSADDTLANASSDVDFMAHRSQKYRLATTYFDHDTDIEIRVTATFTFEHELFEGRTSSEFEYDETFTFRAWNLLQNTGTDSLSNGTFSSVFDTISRATLGHLHTYIGSGINHGLNPATIDAAMDEVYSEMTSRALESTAFMAEVHGSVDFIMDSHAADGYFYYPIQSQIATKITQGYPGFNVIALWSCETFAAGSSSWAGAYGINSPARAYLGFAELIYTNCWTGAEWDAAEAANFNDPYQAGYNTSRVTSDHVDVFCDHLTIGSTVVIAHEIADDEVPMVNREYVDNDYWYWKVPMQINGDEDTRLKFVYLTPTERATIESQSGEIDRFWIRLPIQ